MMIGDMGKHPKFPVMVIAAKLAWEDARKRLPKTPFTLCSKPDKLLYATYRLAWRRYRDARREHFTP